MKIFNSPLVFSCSRLAERESVTMRTADKRAWTESGYPPASQSNRAVEAPVAALTAVVAVSSNRDPLLVCPDLLSAGGAALQWIILRRRS